MSLASIEDSDVCSKYLRHVAALFENNNRDKRAVRACVSARAAINHSLSRRSVREP